MKKIGMSFALLLGLAMQAACGESDDGKGGTGPTSGNTEQPPAPGDETQAPPSAPVDPLAPPPKPGPGMALVRAIHASADAPSVDVYVKGSAAPIVTGLAYGQTSGWIEVPKGTYELELRAAPSKPTDAIAHETGPLEVPDGAMISCIAGGLLGSTAPDAALRIVPLVEQFDTVPGGQVRVRVVHAGSDAPSVDLDVGNDDPTKPEVSALARFADTGKAGVDLPAGALAVGVAKDGARVTAFTTPKLPSGAQVLVVATGLLAKLPRERDGFSLLAIGPSGSVGFIKQDPIVYALHASPDAPAVDAFVGNAEIFDNLSFGQLSKPIQVQPGEYQVDFYPTAAGPVRPAGTPAASGSTGQLAAGERYLAEATGFLSEGKLALLGYREGFAIDPDKAVIRAVHGSPDAPNVDIGVVANASIETVLFANLGYTKASDEKGLAADEGHIPIGVGAAASSTPAAVFTLPAQKGQRAFVVAAGALAPKEGQQSFRLLFVDTAPPTWTVTTILPH